MPRFAALLLTAVIACAGCAKNAEQQPKTQPEERPLRVAAPESAPPIRTPPVKQTDEVSLPDDFTVVGVVAGGKPRAYSLKALSAGDGHVVNDLLGDVPVTVVYCDFSKTIRVYTDATRGKALELAQVGHSKEGLLLRHASRIYEHKSGKPPVGDGPALALKTHEHEETTWKAWRARHPKSEVYVGPDPLPLGPDKP